MPIERPYTGFALDSVTIVANANASGGREQRVVKWLAIARSAGEAMDLVRQIVPGWRITVTGSDDTLLAKARKLGLLDGAVHKLDQ